MLRNIEAGFEFGGPIELVLEVFKHLPEPLRPVYFGHEENIGRDSNRIDDQKRFGAFVAKSKSGFFLLGPAVTYSVRIADSKPLLCDCFLDVAPEVAYQFLEHMAKAKPIFGFACVPNEREQRNRVTTPHGVNTIESWVGRDTNKYVPGFYWLTLLSEILAKQHGIPIPDVVRTALKHVELEGGQHLFRFYERPEDWQETSAVAQLCESLLGVFNVEKVKLQLIAAKNFLELNSILREWR